MLTVSEIRRLTYDNTYRKGRSYYQQGYVRKIDVRWHSESDGESAEVEGEIRGSGRKVYLAEIHVSPEDEITDYRCECPAYESYWGMCKHCVALGLAFQERQKKERYERRLPGMGIQRETTAELAQIIYRSSVKNRMNRLGGPDGSVELECYFQTEQNGLLLEMKIGEKRKYIVKNLVKLVRDTEELRDVKYGTALQFVHDETAFTPQARDLLRLLQQVVVSRYPDYRDAYYEVSSNFRYILLRGDDLVRVLDHFRSGTITLNEQEVPVRDENPSLTLHLTEVHGGAELAAESILVYGGGSGTYVRTSDGLYRVTADFAEQVLPLWLTIKAWSSRHFRGKSPHLFLSRADYGSFCGNLLPRLEPFVAIESGSLDLSEFAPAEPEFILYLSMPEEDVIEAAARVRYDAQEYDLLEGKSQQAGRNPERENECRALLQQYFRPREEERPTGKRKQRRMRSMLEWVDDVPARDLDADDGRPVDWDSDIDEYGLPVRDLDADLHAPALRAYRTADGGAYQDEAEADQEAEEVLLPQDGLHFFAVGEDAIYPLVEHGLSELASCFEIYADDSIRQLSIRPAPKVNLGIGIAGELIDLDVEIEGMDAWEIAGILGNYRRKKKYYRLRNGDFVRLADNGMETLSELAEGLGLTGKELEQGKIGVPMYRAMYLDGVLKDGTEARVKRLPNYRQLVRGMRDFTDSDFEIPEGITAELRRYQREGFRWLCTLCEYHFGGILADDMGLGKTLQMIALLLRRKEEGYSLVVSPASLVYNWESEVHRFAPGLSVQVIAGSAAERREQIERCALYDVSITSYDLLKRDVDSYESLSFDCLVLDEAQYIKNAGTQAAQAAKQIRAGHRFALTGTPIENRLSDLWSIFDFLMPGYLFAYSRFRDEWEAPIVKENDEQAVKRLSRMVTPFILRRRKADVLKDLPDKLEETVVVQMTPEQKRIYEASTEQIRRSLAVRSEQEIRESRIQILAELTRLRQLCCSPELVYENYHGGSGKTDACLELLQNAVDGGHHVLVFSQFTSMLELLQKAWARTGGDYLYLSGKDSKRARQQMVERFQRGEVPVFFISLKAGGTGLNLTAADIVIHVDPWWNVAAQNQATDRAHRIGQEKVVSVMKLVARDSIEEKILRLQQKKAALADSVVEGEGVRDITLNKEELMALFG